MYYDMHTHSHFSTDSHMEMEKGILNAIEKNLSGIAFTDHIDIDFTNREDEYLFDLDEYFVFINQMIENTQTHVQLIADYEYNAEAASNQNVDAIKSIFIRNMMRKKLGTYLKLDEIEDMKKMAEFEFATNKNEET